MKHIQLIFLSLLFLTMHSVAIAKPALRLGIQASGTLEWELAKLIQNINSLYTIEPHILATAEAGKIALQSGAVDMIVSDWLWVSAMRTKGVKLSFYPYSSTSGALMVAENSPIHSLADLKGKRIGIAGGELDKNWLLLQAVAKVQKFDLSDAEKVFGTPPLINEQIKQHRVDAVLNYWHFAAKLQALGYRQLIDGKDLIKQLGINQAVPTLGYVFKEEWAIEHQKELTDFFKASQLAKAQLCHDDLAWTAKLTPTHETDPALLSVLRQHYCDGLIQHFGISEQEAAEHIYNVLKQSADTLAPGTFWADH